MILRTTRGIIDDAYSTNYASELLALIDNGRPSWHAQAACRGHLDVMFDQLRLPEALAICHGCPVLDDCRAAAADQVDCFGIWGGMSKRRREALRRERRAAA